MTAEISPDNRRVLTAGESGVLVWDLEKGERIFEVAGKNQGGISAAYSPDGARIVTANVDGTARVWDAATGEPRSPPLRHGGRRRWGTAGSPGGWRSARTVAACSPPARPSSCASGTRPRGNC